MCDGLFYESKRGRACYWKTRQTKALLISAVLFVCMVGCPAFFKCRRPNWTRKKASIFTQSRQTDRQAAAIPKRRAFK